jgi:protein-L-isoaspartate(D-aspartate) O-methyltransferase
MDEATIRKYQQAIVDQMKQANNLTTQAVEEAFMKVPRHLFVPDEPLEKVYSDVAIAMKRGDKGQWTSSSSMPAIMAIMLEQLNLKPGQRVLEIGAGTGFNAALIGSIVGPSGKVVTVDIQPEMIEHARKSLDVAGFNWIQTVAADGGLGYADSAPYDRIILTVGSDVIPPAWREQLVQGGILVLPFTIAGVQLSVAFEKRGEELISISMKGCGFMPLQGAFAHTVPDETQLGPDPRLLLFSEKGKGLPVSADIIFTWLSQEIKDWPTGVTLARWELESGLNSWLGIQDLQAHQAKWNISLLARGDLADENIIPALIRYGGEWKATVTGGLLASDSMAVLMRAPSQIVPLVDMTTHQNDNEPFELYIRNFGPGTQAVEHALEYIQKWNQAGRPAAWSWKIRAIPAEMEYQLAEGEYIVNKPWTKLIIRPVPK